MSVILETTIGDLVIDLFTDERPRASLNFLKLCKVKFYNYSLFHFVQRNFLAQTGDPTGSGRGGESIFRSFYGDQAKFFEAETKPRIKHVKKGTVSMVNNGNDMHGSQFFITLGDNLDYLDGQHTVFGEVAEGFEVLNKLNEAICDDNHQPYQDIRITHTVILDDPFDDPPGLKIPDRSPEPTKEQLDSGRIGADEEIDDTKGKTIEEVQDMIEEREFKAGTQILEMVGDIPDADIKPPDNVLFVCKLNPVTTDEDLEIIFSRFGPIKSCEIIRDSVSKESLQYAFIEYENVEDCERAYFKMDNVLIDDRRIHVDFSQSVAKLVHNKPGSKPVYELKDKKDDKPKLKIKEPSRKEKYDLVFEQSGSDVEGRDENKFTSKKHSKRHKDYKKQRRLSSEEQSPDDKRRRRERDHKIGGNRHGNKRRDSYDDSSEHSPDGRRGRSERSGHERSGHESRRDRKPGKSKDDREYRDKKGQRELKEHRSRYAYDSDDGEHRSKGGQSGYQGDRDSSEERYRKSDDKSRNRERRHREEVSSEERYSRDNRGHNKDKKDRSRNKGYYSGEEKPTKGIPKKRHQDRQKSVHRDTGDNRGHGRRGEDRRDNRGIRDYRSSSVENTTKDYSRKKRQTTDKKTKQRK